MSVVMINSKGQLWIPVAVRGTLGWQPGDKVVFEIEDEEQGAFSIRTATPEELKAS